MCNYRAAAPALDWEVFDLFNDSWAKICVAPPPNKGRDPELNHKTPDHGFCQSDAECISEICAPQPDGNRCSSLCARNADCPSNKPVCAMRSHTVDPNDGLFAASLLAPVCVSLPR